MYNLISSKQKFPSSVDVHRRFDKRQPEPMSNVVGVVHEGILDFIGHTPLVKLQRIPQQYGIKCDIYAKCEFMNPGGSVKDRVAHAMMIDAAKNVPINVDTVFVEPTSGNTGIGVALNAVIRGAKCTIVIHRKNSDEKINTMRLLGAEVIEINNNQSAMDLAREIKLKDPNHVVMLDQFENDINPKTHYEQTAAEILHALNSVDLFVAGAGTGGTLTGIGWRLKDDKAFNCFVLAADPDGSIMFCNKDDSQCKSQYHPFLVEGIGSKEQPVVLDTSVADAVGKVTDEAAFNMARELASKEGLLCGGSGGLAMAAAIKYVRMNSQSFGPGKRVVVILPDGIRNYMSKFVRDQWMEAHRFKEPPKHTMTWWEDPVSNINTHKIYTVVHGRLTCADAIKQMDNGQVDLAVVVDDQENFIGAVSKDSLRHIATNPTKLPDHPSEVVDFKHEKVQDHLIKDCYTLSLNGKKGMPTVGLLSRILDITPFVVLVEESRDLSFGSKGVNLKPVGVFDGEDVLDYIIHQQ